MESVDRESPDGSADNELNEEDGVSYRWRVQEVKFGNTSDSRHMTESTRKVQSSILFYLS